MKKLSHIIRQQSGQTRLAILLATVLVSLAPFWLASGHTALQGWLSNKALAATDATGRVEILQNMAEPDRKRHAGAVRAFLIKSPESIMGLSAEDVVMALSQPGLKRVDGEVQAWQYRGKNCVLDVFFSMQGGVVYYEMRAHAMAVMLPVTKKDAAADPAVDHMSCLKGLTSI